MIDRRWRLDALALAIVLCVSGALVWRKLFDGWIPWDDGAMAQMAERALAGEIPHRDFDDLWTGGWTYFQAGIFRVFGPSLAALRVPIFVSWLLGLVVAFSIARRFASTFAAAVATFVCALWSLYAWHLPLPNWYYAAFALWSAWSVIKYTESGRRGWLVLAGAGAGFALTFKISGLFLLAGLLLWAIARAGGRSGAGRSGPDDPAAHPVARGYGALAFALAGAYALLVVLLVARLPLNSGPLLHFAMPNVALALWTARRASGGGLTAEAGMRALGTLLVPLLAGFAAALLPLVAWYAVHGALGDLLYGTFIRPGVRLGMTWVGPPGRMATLLFLPVPLLLLCGSAVAKVPRPRVALAFAAVAGGVLGLVAAYGSPSAEVAQIAVRLVPVALPLAGLAWSWKRPGCERDDDTIFLLVACSTAAVLLQVPYAALAYFLYTAPIAMLAGLAFAHGAGEAGRPVTVFAGTFLLLLGLRGPAAREGWSDGLGPMAILVEGRTPAPLPFERAGIRSTRADSVELAALSHVMSGRPSGPIYVSRGAPELYFLLNRPNPTRIIFDVLSGSEATDPRAVMQTLDRAGVLTIVFANAVMPQGDLTVAALHARFRLEFPRHVPAGGYEVLWRDSVGGNSADDRSVDQEH